MANSLSVSAILMTIMLSFLMFQAIAAEIDGGGEFKSTQREFDYFALSLQWPPTFCRRTRHRCSSNACCRGSNAPTEFTIHGLWPDYNDGTWSACCTQSGFDEKEISTLLDPMKKYWPSLSCGSPTNCLGGRGSFWGHEWGNYLEHETFATRGFAKLLPLFFSEKHETYSSPVTHDEYSYFLTTLNVYFKHNVTRVLNEAGYIPSNTEKYPLGGIVSAIQNAFKATSQLVCSKGAVEELRLCFYKDFKPRDCATSSSNSAGSCPRYSSLPSYVPLGLGPNGNATSWLPDSEDI